MKYLNILLSILIFSFSSLKAQESKFGSNPKECEKNDSICTSFYKQKQYAEALNSWRIIFNICPASSKNIYIHGAKIITFQIEQAQKAKNTTLAFNYIDTLMMVYDKRIQFFGEETQVLGFKGIDLLIYDSKRTTEAYGYLIKSIEDANASVPVALSLMKASVTMYKEGTLSKEKVRESYSKSIQVVKNQIQKSPENKEFLIAKDNIETMYINVGTDCNTLETLLRSKFEANPNDIKLLKTIVGLNAKQNCSDSKLLYEVSQKLYELEPSSVSALNIARMAKKNNENSKAILFYEKAIELQTNADDKARYYLEIADLYKTIGQLLQAKNNAQKAIENKANWGLPYLFIGKLYASSSENCGENEFEKKSVYWLAVDMFVKAKTVDLSIAENADKLIENYCQYFPSRESAVLYNFIEGQTYNIGCWINETTTIRF